MDLVKYLYLNDITKEDFGKHMDLCYVTVLTVCQKKNDIGVLLAKKIIDYTKGEVTLEDLLPNLEKLALHRKSKKKYKKQKKDVNNNAKI